MKRFEKLLIDKLFFGEKAPKRSRKKIEPEYDFDYDLDFVALLKKEQDRAKSTLAKIDTFFKDHEKLSKKEDKKGTEFISAPRLAMLLVATFPITAPIYVFWFSNMLRSMGWK